MPFIEVTTDADVSVCINIDHIVMFEHLIIDGKPGCLLSLAGSATDGGDPPPFVRVKHSYELIRDLMNHAPGGLKP